MAVYKRNETWWIDYYFEGQRLRQKIGSRKRDAEEALSKIKVLIAAGEFVHPSKRKSTEDLEPEPITFRDFVFNEFLPWSAINHSAKHHQLQRSILRVQLIPFLGQRDLNEISQKELEIYVAQRRRGFYKQGKKRKPVKEATVNRDIVCLKILFRKAVEWNSIKESPARDLKTFKELPNPPRLLEQEEIIRLLSEVPDHLFALVACAVYAGLRSDELFHLQWRDINLKTGELTVVAREDHPTKSRESRRIPINPVLLEAFRRHPRRIGSSYVFCNQETGRPYDNVRKSLTSAAKRAGIEDGVGMHQLRHAFCSHALMQGIDPRTVQRWMGHKDIRTTLRYAHISPDHEKAAIQRLQYESSHYMDTKAI